MHSMNDAQTEAVGIIFLRIDSRAGFPTHLGKVMGKKSFLLAGIIFAGNFFAEAANPTLAEGVKVQSHNGWDHSLMMTASKSKARAVLAPAVGGRVIYYGLNDENILYEAPGSRGKTLQNSKTGFPAGGYQCDLGPELGGVPEHLPLWLGPYGWRTPRASTVVLTSEPSRQTGIQLEKEVVLDPESGELGIAQRMKNVSDKQTAYCLWDRTLCGGGGYAFFPLNSKSRFPSGWSIRRKQGDREVYDGTQPFSSSVKVIAGILVAETKGQPAKIGADSDAEWIAYVRGKLLFVKYYPYFPKGHYSDGGNSVEVYWDERVAELEPLSPEIKLEPGESYTFPEKWALFPLKEAVTSFEQAAALAGRVPASPFKVE